MTSFEPSIEQSAGFPGGFTVLMAVYYRDNISLFERAVHSVYANTLPPDAFILVVDGPVPQALANTIQSLQGKYALEVLQLPDNVGLAKSLNAGLKTIKTKWVARADADDYNLPCRFEMQAAVVVQLGNSVDCLGGAIREVDLEGRELGVRRTVENFAEIRRYAMHRNPFNHMTVAYRTELVLRCGGYPEIHLKEDYALWAEMLVSGAQMCNLFEILVHATAGKDMYHRRGGWSYAISEINLQKYLVRIGLKSWPNAIISGLIGVVVSILPAQFRGWIYEKTLRTRV